MQPLNRVLNAIERQDQWRSRQQLRQLVCHWADLVGEAVAAQTRPLGIQRQVLQVATASSAWAQNLTFERQRLLQKINTQLNLDLSDIRFSTARWSMQPTAEPELTAESARLWREHPSWVADLSSTDAVATQNSPKPKDVNTAFQSWAHAIQSRSQQLPLCPQCRCPAPTGELKRWTVCALCAAKQW